MQAEAHEDEFPPSRVRQRPRGLEPSPETCPEVDRENPLPIPLIASPMRAWSVVVPRNRAEEVRRLLLDQGLLLKPLRIQSDGDTVRLPTQRRVELGFPTEQAEF